MFVFSKHENIFSGPKMKYNFFYSEIRKEGQNREKKTQLLV